MIAAKLANRANRRFTLGGRGSQLSYGPKTRLLATTHTLVEGVHFDLSYTSPKELGHKALAVPLSDLASAGTTPCFAQVAIGVRQETSEPFLGELAAGMERLAARYGMGLSTSVVADSPTAFLMTVTAFGERQHKLLSPRGAKPGDLLVVTGHLGNSAAGLKCLRLLGRQAATAHGPLLAAHLTPEPRVLEAQHLARHPGIHAMVDLSDGLSADLHLLVTSSGVGAWVYEEQLPISPLTRRAAELFTTHVRQWALYGAEDFELLFTVAARQLPRLRRSWRLKTPFTVIGQIREAHDGVCLVEGDGSRTPLQPRLWHPLVRRRRIAK